MMTMGSSTVLAFQRLIGCFPCPFPRHNIALNNLSPSHVPPIAPFLILSILVVAVSDLLDTRKDHGGVDELRILCPEGH